jgi:hypothetical protein
VARKADNWVVPLLTKIGKPDAFNAVTLAEAQASHEGVHLADMNPSERQRWVDRAQWHFEFLVQRAEIS